MSHHEEADDERAQPGDPEADAKFLRLEPVARGDELVRREAVERALGVLARAFVTSEEVNDKFMEATAALEGLEVECLSDVIGGMSAAGTPFTLRALGMRRFDDAKVRENLSEFLRLALFPAARIRTAKQEELLRKQRPVAAPPEVAGAGDAEGDEILREMIETAEQYEQDAIFLENPDRLVAPEVFDDKLPAHGDLELAASRVSSLLSAARREFDVLTEWRGSHVPARVAKEFGAAVDDAEACLREVLSPRIPASFVASDVHDGVIAAFRLVGAGPHEVSGSRNAADILARIVLELAGLTPGLEHDDDTRAEYTRQMRRRATREANFRGGQT